MPKKISTMQYTIANIKRYQSINQMNDHALYTRAQIGRSTFSDRINRKTRAFDLDELDRISRVLGVTVEDLLVR